MFQTSYFNDSYSDFKSALQSYDKNFNENLFVKAIEVAETSHKDQFRASGDPYIIHPYEVCKSLIELKLDTETVINSVKKTNRCVTVEEGYPVCSIGNYVSSVLMQHAFDYLDAPVINCSGKDVPMPYAANLEKLALVTKEDVLTAAKAVLYR